ncbi:MAG: metallophosphoesterase [Cyanobacteria bacterium P01_H01_bin.119]
MEQRQNITLAVAVVLMALALGLVLTLEAGFESRQNAAREVLPLLSDPFLQAPTPSSVRVVWFTEFEGSEHLVAYGRPEQMRTEESLQTLTIDALGQTVEATTRPMSRLREDQRSNLAEPQSGETPVKRSIWRHEAAITDLTPGQRLPYRVLSMETSGTVHQSNVFSLAPSPPAGQPLTILLTSDHQSMPMTPANLQKAAETAAVGIDAVFLAGDLVNIPDRASEWFDDARGNAFFPSLQGRADSSLQQGDQTTQYQGGRIIQFAPLFPAVGNHEVMGRFSTVAGLNEQFNDPMPYASAEQIYAQQAQTFNPKDESAVRVNWLKNNSFNTDTYEEIFSLPVSIAPDSGAATGRYYATTFGDVRLVSLFVTNIWRSPALSADTRGRYREKAIDTNIPDLWGHGQHIFASLEPNSPQYQWLEQELASDAFQQAKYKVVMFHHPPHSLGDNVVPPFANPLQVSDLAADSTLQTVRYEYPKDQDQIIRDLIPLLETAGVQLVLYGHSHIWNRFVSPSGMHFLETSNVGNTYGAFWGDKTRTVPTDEAAGEANLGTYLQANYAAAGDPNGLEPIVPTVAPLTDENTGTPLPYLASNELTAFTLFDTGTGTVSSYYFDTREPGSDVVKFDEFDLNIED